MVQPEVEILSGGDEADETLHSGRIVAVYEAASKVSTRIFRTLLDRILKEVDLACRSAAQERTESAFNCHRWPKRSPRRTALRLALICGCSTNFARPAQTRLIFDEFFWLECGLALEEEQSPAWLAAFRSK